ncbi:hypothetical protein AB3S75_002083 [Citrus x aurantiifolia]
MPLFQVLGLWHPVRSMLKILQISKSIIILPRILCKGQATYMLEKRYGTSWPAWNIDCISRDMPQLSRWEAGASTPSRSQGVPGSTQPGKSRSGSSSSQMEREAGQRHK